MQRSGVFYKLGLVIIAVFLSVAVAVVDPVNQAQAAVNASPWLKNAGSSLADEFDMTIANGGFSDAQLGATGGLTGVTGFHGAASGAAGLLGAIGAGVELGLVIGTGGLKLAGKLHSDNWDEYTKNVDCNQAGKTMVAFANSGIGLLGFGDQYSCKVKAKTSSFETIDKNGLVKSPVPDPPASVYSIDYTRDYHISASSSHCGKAFSFRVHFTGFDKNHFIADITNSNSFPISTDTSSSACLFIQQYKVFFDGIKYATFQGPLSDDAYHHYGLTIAAGQTVTGAKFKVDSIVGNFPEAVIDKKLQCIGTDGTSLANCLGGEPAGTSTAFKADTGTLSRQISCRVTATDGTVIQAPGVSYTDSDGIPLESSKWGCNKAWQQTLDAGKVPKTVTATSTFPGATGDPQLLYNAPVTSEAQGVATDQPSCVNATGGNDGCVYRLMKRDGGKLRSCSDADVWDSCADWATEVQTDPQAYQCRYGDSNVSIDKCSAYEPTFKTAYGGKLSYQNDNHEKVSIDPPTNAMAPPDTKSCWAGVISWNPLDWVLTPVKCALVWAFVPTDTDFADVSKAWDHTPPGVAIAAVKDGVIDNPDLGTQCLGPHVLINQSVFGQTFHIDAYPLSSCDEPMRGIASTCRLILSCLMITAAAYACIRNLASVVHAPPLGGAETS